MLVTFSQMQALLKPAMSRLGVERFGLSPLGRPRTFDHYVDWIKEGLHGEMKYLEDHQLPKGQPEVLLPGARSVISVAFDYVDHPAPLSKWPLKALPVALYAKGYDYHFWLKEKLQRLCSELSTQMPGQKFLAMTDSYPVLERDWAERSGLGWFGKNTCLISRDRGSFFLLGEIYCTLELTENQSLISPNYCGTCTKCLEACPTQALEKPLRLNSTKCISYWTIEAKENPPHDMRRAVGEWLFGCDICQSVCPWNQKVFGSEKIKNEILDRGLLIEDITWVLETSVRQLMKAFADTPIVRTGGRRLKRNAIISAVHYQLVEIIPLLEKLANRNDELSEVVTWAMSELQKDQLSLL